MTLSPLAGKPAPQDLRVDLARLEREYYARWPDMADPTQRVSFGTSGHRGSPLHGVFTEAHILAITQAICDYRRSQGTDGPLYMGKDTHALSGPAQRTALEVLAANGGLKVVTASGWFAARPSGTEHIYKIYAESCKDEKHLEAIVAEAQPIVDSALQASGPGRREREGRR
jgi:phosphoglucomutase